MARVELEAVISARDNASKTFKKFGANTQKFARGFDKAVVGGLIAGTVAVTAFGVASVKAFSEQQAVEKRLVAGLKNVSTASKLTAKNLMEQASALQTVTRFGDEAIVSAQGILSTFQMNADTISVMTPRLLDMAEGVRKATGETVDLEQVSIAMGKAMTMGAGALSRYGVVLTETQREQFNQAEGMKKANVLAEILDQNYKGLAKAAGDTLAGQLNILTNAFGDLQEIVGEGLAEQIQPYIKQLTEWASKKETQQKIVEITEKFIEFFAVVASKAPVVIEWIKKIVAWFQTGLGKTALVALGVLVTGVAAAGGSIIGAMALISGAIFLVVKAVGVLKQSFIATFEFIYWSVRTKVEQLKGLLSELKGALTGTNRGAKNVPFVPFFESGGLVPRTGPAILHAGEQVLPAGAHTGTGGDGVTVNIYGNVAANNQGDVENLAETVARQFKLSQMGAA